MKPVNDTIKAARVQLGLSEDEVSRLSGVSWNEYFEHRNIFSESSVDAAVGERLRAAAPRGRR